MVVKRAFIDTPNGQIHYCQEGSGEPLLLLHQTACSVDEYADVLPYLAKRMNVIAMDTIGYGDSYKPKSAPAIEDYAKGVITLLDALNIKKTSIVGHHTGALIGIEVAAAYPERVNKLILSGPVYINEKVAQLLSDMFQWKIRENGSHYTELWNLYRKLAPLAPPSLLQRLILDEIKAGEISTFGELAVAKYVHMEERLKLVQCPTLILWGTKDLDFVSENRAKVENNISGSKVVDVEDGTFIIMYEMPEKVAQLVLEFL